MNDHLGRTFSACALSVLRAGAVAVELSGGTLDPDGSPGALLTRDSLFDLASLTKLACAVLLLRGVDEGHVSLDHTVGEIAAILGWPRPDDALSGVTLRKVASHSAGFPALVPLYKSLEPRLAGNPELRARYLRTLLTEPLEYAPGSKVIYSDRGFMLLGFIVEELSGVPLREHARRLAQILGLTFFGYGPCSSELSVATERCPIRGRRMRGEVHDENCWYLGGVTGHAGLFGDLGSVVRFGEALRTRDERLLSAKAFGEMLKVQATAPDARRGIGVLFSYRADESTTKFLAPEAFGHYGFTGVGVWIDPTRDVTIVTLTNRVYYGRENAPEIFKFRSAVHEAVARHYPERR